MNKQTMKKTKILLGSVVVMVGSLALLPEKTLKKTMAYEEQRVETNATIPKEKSQVFTLSDWTYDETDTTITLTNYNKTSTSIYVPGEVNGKQVTIKDFSIFPKEMTHLTIEETNGQKVGLGTTNLSSIFLDNKSIQFLNLNGLDTSSVTDMSGMFRRATNLTSLDVSQWDTSNVTDMSYMFNSATSLASLDVSQWDTSNVTDMSYMFNNATSLTSLDLNQWNTSNVTNMSSMFRYAENLMSLNLNGWNTSNVSTMNDMFGGAFRLTSLDVSQWDTSNVTDMSYMFSGAKSLASLDVSQWDTSNVTNMSRMFLSTTSLTSLDLNQWDTSNVSDMSYMFRSSGLTSLVLSQWDTSSVTDMNEMFRNAESLMSLNLNGWNTSNVTNMYGMFSYTKSLVNLNLNGWNTSNVTNMSDMFRSAEKLTSLNLSQWNTSNVTNMSYMFRNAKSLTSLDVSQWDTSNVTDMSDMFRSTKNLTSLNLSQWDTSNVTDMSYMFYDTPKLSVLDFSGWDTSNVTAMKSMFDENSNKPLLVVTTNEMIKNARLLATNRSGVKLNFNANGGMFEDGSSEWASDEITVIGSIDENHLNSLVSDALKRVKEPIKDKNVFSGWNSTTIDFGVDLERIYRLLSQTFEASWLETEKDLLIQGTVEPTIISIDVPSAVITFTLNPNLENSFVAPDFELVNQSNAPLNVSLKCFEQVSSSLNDVLPTKYNSWKILNQEQSKDIALALNVFKDEGVETYYVAEVQSLTKLGVIAPASSLKFGFEALHGHSFSERLTLEYRLNFVFSLLD